MPRKSTRNAQGGGTIRQRPDGRWEARYTVGHDPGTGKQKQRSVYGATQKEVRQRLAQAIAAIDEGTYFEPTKMTVGEWLDIWRKEYTANVKPHTKKSYDCVVENHIRPQLGNRQLQQLTPVHIQKFINEVKNQKKGKETISPKTIKNIHGILHRALQQAVQIGYIRVNPANLTILPKRKKAEITPLQDEQVAIFLKTIEGHQFENLYRVDLFTGIRQSELLGLMWNDIDFERGILFIRRQLQYLGAKHGGYQFTTPKNGNPRQIIPATHVMDILRRQRIMQAEMRLMAGELWNNADNLVFTNELGGHIKHDLIYRHVKRIFAKMGLPNLRFHDLRHSYAVLSIQAGDDIKTVQENLGHYSAAFTLDVYGHVTEQMRRDSADRMDNYIRSISTSKG